MTAGIPSCLARLYWWSTRRDPVLQGLYIQVIADIASSGRAPRLILDVGAGPGTLALRLAQAFPHAHITGVDVSRGMVKIANRNARRYGLESRLTFTVADAARLPFDDACFDVIVSTMVIPFWKDPRGSLGEIYRCLAIGGSGYVYDLNADAADSAEKAFRQTYGRTRAYKYLRLARTRYTMTPAKADGLISALAPRVATREDKDVFLCLRFDKP